MNIILSYDSNTILCQCSINLKRALKRASNSNISGSQGMQRQEESKNVLRVRQNENPNKKDSPMFSIIELILKC
jgi:hypothetical protein